MKPARRSRPGQFSVAGPLSDQRLLGAEQYGHRQVWVKGYVHEVVIACASEVIVRHKRSYEPVAVVFDPLHYLALLEQKTRALDQAAPLADWHLPECFAQLRRLLEARLKKNGSREYVQVLRLLETFDLSELTLAIEDALRLGTISFDAVRHLLFCRIERRPPQLDMQNYPHLQDGAGADHLGRRLHELACGSVRMSGAETSSTNIVTHTAETPQSLLEYHLKELRLPTILREYDKVARQCAVEQLDYPRYLLRMTELELMDRERRATERRIRQASFPVIKTMTAWTSWPFLR